MSEHSVIPRGLTQKWFVWRKQMPHTLEELRADPWYRAEYARDAEGRLWCRKFYEIQRGHRRYTRRDPWHVADPYQWFPSDAAPPPGTRLSNHMARLPRREDRFKVGQRVERVPHDREVAP